MKVSLETHGGLAAGINIQRPPTVVDTADLAPGEAAELARLVDAVASAAPAEAGPGRTRDAMSYTVVVDDGRRPVTLTRSDRTMSPEFAELLGWIRTHAPERPGR